jgi:hypothetical protein
MNRLSGMAAASFEYIEVFYNRTRRHSTLGYKSPMQSLDDWLMAQQYENLVAWNLLDGRRKQREAQGSCILILNIVRI